jgi:hypothetical protein
MAEVTPLVRKAVNWISHMREEEGKRLSLNVLIDQASARFNLSPKDTEFLQRFFEEQMKSEAKKA